MLYQGFFWEKEYPQISLLQIYLPPNIKVRYPYKEPLNKKYCLSVCLYKK